MMRIETEVVFFEFISSDRSFRTMLFEAVELGQIPDWYRSFGSEAGNQGGFTAMWKTSDAPAVRQWADGIGATLYEGP